MTKTAAGAPEPTEALPPAGEYFALVEEFDTEEGHNEGTVTVDLVAVQEGISFEDGPSTELTNTIRQLWRLITDPDRPDDFTAAPEQLVQILSGFEPRIAHLTLQGAAQGSEFDAWAENQAWIRLVIGPQGAILSATEVERRLQGRLRKAFGSAAWFCATAATVRSQLDRIAPIERAIFHDVGQGAAVSLYGPNSPDPTGYFDVGWPTSRNAITAPSTSSLCLCEPVPVVLSHWDLDHWGAANRHPSLLARDWLVPRQHLGLTHSLAAARIATRGKLLVVKRSSRPSSTDGSLTLRHGTGSGRNHSGLIMVVNQLDGDGVWFFPADARYSACGDVPSTVTVLQATHHGGRYGGATPPPPGPSSGPYRRLVYAYGANNVHQHPTQGTGHHNASGWSACPQDVRHTAPDPSNANQRSSIVVGWSGPPTPSASQPTCRPIPRLIS